jgi:hypothetical protein
MMKMASARSVIASAFALAVLAARLHVVTSEIVPLSLILDADSTTVHYIQGYITAPGYVDISDLKFVSTEEPEFVHGEDDDMFEAEDDDSSMTNSTTDDDNTPEPVVPQPAPTSKPTRSKPAPTAKPVVPQPAPTAKPARNKPVPTAAPVATSKPARNKPAATTAPAPTGGDGGNRTRFLADGDDDDGTDELGGDNEIEDSVLSIVMFRLPDACANTPGGCDWSTLGVGAYDETVEGGITYCCTEDAWSRKLCRPKQIGQLIVNNNFKGELRQLEIPAQGDFIMSVEEKKKQFKETHNGNYVLVLVRVRFRLNVVVRDWFISTSHNILSIFLNTRPIVTTTVVKS